MRTINYKITWFCYEHFTENDNVEKTSVEMY